MSERDGTGRDGVERDWVGGERMRWTWVGMRQSPICHFRSQRGWGRDAAGWEGKGQEVDGLGGAGRGWDRIAKDCTGYDLTPWDGIGLNGIVLDCMG